MEYFRDIKGYEGKYRVSNLGNVLSLISNKRLKPKIGTSGYFQVNLSYDSSHKSFSIHQLMAITFLNHKPNGFVIVVDHIDNNKLNNKLENLQLVTNRVNSTKDNTNKSGYSCIYPNNNSFLVRICINGEKKTFGTFKNIEDAIEKRDFILNNL